MYTIQRLFIYAPIRENIIVCLLSFIECIKIILHIKYRFSAEQGSALQCTHIQPALGLICTWRVNCHVR